MLRLILIELGNITNHTQRVSLETIINKLKDCGDDCKLFLVHSEILNVFGMGTDNLTCLACVNMLMTHMGHFRISFRLNSRKPKNAPNGVTNTILRSHKNTILFSFNLAEPSTLCMTVS